MKNSLLYIYFVLGFLFSDVSLIGQNVKISEPIDVTNEIDYKLIDRFQNQILLYRRTETKFFIQSFSPDLTSNWIKTIEFDKSKNIKPLRIISGVEGFSILYYFFKGGDTHIYSAFFDTSATLISDISLAVFENQFVVRDFHLPISQDKRYVIAFAPSSKNNLEMVRFDMHSQLVDWQMEVSLPRLNYFDNFEQVVVSNKGEAFVIYNQNNNRRKRNEHNFLIHQVINDSVARDFVVPFHNYISYDLDAQYDELNQKLVVAGFYSVTNDDKAEGIFYFNTDLKANPSVHIDGLGEEFIRSLTGRRRKRMDGIQNFHINQLILRKDGGVLLVAEQQYQFVATGYYFMEEEPSRQADYLYENILVASIHPTGEVHWKDVLYKSQLSENDNARYSSFFAFKTNRNIRFLYNNDISWDTSIFEYIVDGRGQIQRNVVTHQHRKSGLLPQLKSGLQISANELITVAERDNKLRLVKINY